MQLLLIALLVWHPFFDQAGQPPWAEDLSKAAQKCDHMPAGKRNASVERATSMQVAANLLSLFCSRFADQADHLCRAAEPLSLQVLGSDIFFPSIGIFSRIGALPSTASHFGPGARVWKASYRKIDLYGKIL